MAMEFEFKIVFLEYWLFILSRTLAGIVEGRCGLVQAVLEEEEEEYLVEEEEEEEDHTEQMMTSGFQRSNILNQIMSNCLLRCLVQQARAEKELRSNSTAWWDLGFKALEVTINSNVPRLKEFRHNSMRGKETEEIFLTFDLIWQKSDKGAKLQLKTLYFPHNKTCEREVNMQSLSNHDCQTRMFWHLWNHIGNISNVIPFNDKVFKRNVQLQTEMERTANRLQLLQQQKIGPSQEFFFQFKLFFWIDC